MTVDASELRILAHQQHTVESTVIPRVQVVVTKTLFDIEGDAKIEAPVDTGFLQNSISNEADEDGLGGEVGPTAEYGYFVEGGTSRMAAQPYMGPAFDRHVAAFVDGVGQAGVGVL